MDLLPDNLLAMAMSYLEVEDLLACRLVCKRLARLAQHPDVWQDRSIEVHGGREMCPVLRLAPCALEISTYVSSLRSGAACRHGDLRTTSCAAKGLTINVENCGPEHAAKAVQIVNRQAALGRLRVVSLWLADISAIVNPLVLPEEGVDQIFGTLASTPGLGMIILRGNMGQGKRFPPEIGQRGTITPSLKILHCDMVPWPESFCDYLLAGHAATLVGVQLGYIPARTSAPLASTSTARLLAGMPNLHKLCCPMIPGLGEVAACESLRELELAVPTESNSHGALELLRRALQIRRLHLYFPRRPDGEVDDHELGAELIGELASSGRSQVEQLSIDVEDSRYHSTDTQSLLVPHLAARLPSLPALRRLELRLLDPAPLVDAISPQTAPSLRSLHLLDNECPRRMCSHEFLHSRRLGALLSRNPLLHVEVQYATTECLEDDEEDLYDEDLYEKCKACQLDCHKELEGPAEGEDGEIVGVFAHPGGECPSPEDHDSCGTWIHINDVQPVF